MSVVLVTFPSAPKVSQEAIEKVCVCVCVCVCVEKTTDMLLTSAPVQFRKASFKLRHIQRLKPNCKVCTI